MRISKSFATLLCLALYISPVQAQAVWQEPPYPQSPTVGINVEDAWINNGNQVSRIVSLESRAGKLPNERLCLEIGEGPCDFENSKYRASVNALLGFCVTTDSIGCVESVSRNGRALTLLGEAGGSTFSGDVSKDLPDGRNVSLWADPEDSGVKFAVYASMVTNYHKSIKAFRADEFVLTVIPYTSKSGTYRPSESSEKYLDSQGRWIVQSGGFPPECAWVSAQECGQWADFPIGQNEIQVSVRVPSSTGSWFQGRLDSAVFKVEKVSPRVNRLVVSGQPARVPKIYVAIPKDQQTQAQRDAQCDSTKVECFFVDAVGNVRASYENTPGLLEAYRQAAKDRAVAIQEKWSFQVSPAFGNKCLTDPSKVHGIVSTNAAVYQGTAPQFSNGSLNYKVSGYHFGPDGEELIGRYRLIINAETARCLYGFKTTPAQATVTVTGTAGEQSVATTTVGEKNGWLYLDAAGFTFSQKNIKVAFSQPQSFRTAAFPGNSVAISAKQKAQISTYMAKASAAKSINCLAYYSSEAGRSLALARASAACSLAKKFAAKSKTYLSAARAPKPGDVGTVAITAK
ncbi:MAG: hypothetical protein RIS08_1142 [Actinomycetota bacterium]